MKLASVMQLTKLIARSHGRQEILLGDYQRARVLVEKQVTPKKEISEV
jgi:hypothetical protein